MQKLMKRIGNPNRKGFTLIELIIVIIILGILALIIIPQLMGMQEGAVIASCRANQRITNSMAAVVLGQWAMNGSPGLPNEVSLSDIATYNLLTTYDMQCPGPSAAPFVFVAAVGGIAGDGTWECPESGHPPE